MEKYLIEDTEVFDNNSAKEIKTLISFDLPFDDSGVHDSKGFLIKKEFINDLLNFNEKKDPFLKLCEGQPFSEVSTEQFTDRVIITSWKNVENISARLIDSYDSSVILECLIDKESGIYEEREFRASLFNGYDIKQGNLFYLRVFERQNEVKLEIHDDPGLTRIEDFPKMDFVEKFSKSRLFKDKKQT
jgi:hypothetical protein